MINWQIFIKNRIDSCMIEMGKRKDKKKKDMYEKIDSLIF